MCCHSSIGAAGAQHGATIGLHPGQQELAEGPKPRGCIRYITVPRSRNRHASGSRRGGRGASGSRIRHFLCIANQNRACTLGSGNRHASGSRITRHRRFCFKKHGRCEQARNQGPSTDDRVFRNRCLIGEGGENPPSLRFLIID